MLGFSNTCRVFLYLLGTSPPMLALPVSVHAIPYPITPPMVAVSLLLSLPDILPRNCFYLSTNAHYIGAQ